MAAAQGDLPPVHPHGHHEILQIREDAKLWKDGNPNKTVEMLKVYKANPSFLNQGGHVMQDNEKVWQLVLDLSELKDKINGAARAGNKEEVQKSLSAYTKILTEAQRIRAEIKGKKGFAIPIPKKLLKFKKV